MGLFSRLPASWRAHPVATVFGAVGVVLAIMAVFFVWRVFNYVRLIQTGAILNLPQYSARLSLGNIRERGGNAPLADVTTADDPSTGNANAPVTIVQFADFQCPFSQESFQTIRALSAAFPNDVRVQFRDFPLDSIHPRARPAAKAAHCAGEQDKYLQMHDKLYLNSDRLADSDLRFYAEQIGLDLARFDICQALPSTNEEIEADIADGVAAGVRGTPTFFINGARVEGDIPYTILTQIVDELRTAPAK